MIHKKTCIVGYKHFGVQERDWGYLDSELGAKRYLVPILINRMLHLELTTVDDNDVHLRAVVPPFLHFLFKRILESTTSAT